MEHSGDEADEAAQFRALVEVLNALSLLLRVGFFILPLEHEYADHYLTIRLTFIEEDRIAGDCPHEWCIGVSKRFSEQWFMEIVSGLEADELQGIVMHELLHLLVLMGHAEQGIMTPALDTYELSAMDRAQLWLHSNPLMDNVLTREDVERLARIGEWEDPPPAEGSCRIQADDRANAVYVECTP